MSRILFISDLHLGHKNIIDFANAPGAMPRGNATDVAGHDHWVIQQMMSVHPKKRDIWYILGDVAMDGDKLEMIGKVPGRKILIMGNHDNEPTEEYLKVFGVARGPMKAYGMWLSHIPLPEADLFGFPNIHGHQHYNPLADNDNYFNACIEWLPHQRPVTLDWLRQNWDPPIARETNHG